MNTYTTDTLGAVTIPDRHEPCEYDSTCREEATHHILILEPGMNMQPTSLVACESHTAYAIDNGEAEGLGPLAPYPDMGMPSDQ